MVGGGGIRPSQTRKRPRSHPLPRAKRPSSQRLSSQRPPTAPSSLSRPPVLELVPEAPTSQMRSFADLLGNGRSRAEEVLGEDAPDDAWANIANTLDNLGSSSIAPSVIEEGSRIIPEESIDPGETPGETLEVVAHVPIDLSLKTRVKVTSRRELKWAVGRGQMLELTAFGDAMGGKMNGLESVVGGVENAKRVFCRALLNFRYPADTLPMRIAEQWQFLIAGSGKKAWQMRPTGDLLSFAIGRLLKWQASLQALFFSFRRGNVEQFYVLLSTTTVLFNRGKQMKKTGTDAKKKKKARAEEASIMRASFARASTGLRALMSEYEVEFTVLEGTGGFDEPCVVVEGDVAVHCLYNFLLAVGPKASNATDVPVLLADQPFRGCMIASVDVGKARRAIVAGAGKEERYSIELDGLFTPKQVKGICEAVGVVQGGEFVAHLESETSSGMLNRCGHTEAEVEETIALEGPEVLSKIQMSAGADGFSYATRDAG